MKKGQRPARHVRRVRTKRGISPKLINPNISNKQYKKLIRKLGPFSDADKDGVVNIDDCRPFNRKRQDEMSERAEKAFGLPGAEEQTRGEFYRDLLNKKEEPKETVRIDMAAILRRQEEARKARELQKEFDSNY